jgi:basic amino acid/polyamine antiporter, APA family
MGGEAKNAKRDIPKAVTISLLVQGVFCYLIEYFAANYFLSSGYPMTTASGSSAPIGDMMIVIGNSFFGQGGGHIFMLVEAFTVVLALIGTTLSCINTGARVTCAMGKDDEVSCLWACGYRNWFFAVLLARWAIAAATSTNSMLR